MVEESGCHEFDRARELLGEQREDEALDWFEIAIDATALARVRASAAAHVAALLLGFGRPWEVAAFSTTIRDCGGSAALADMLEAAASVQMGDAAGALRLLGDAGAPVATPHDEWFPCSAAGAHATRVRALALAGRVDDARRDLHDALRDAPNGHELWETVAWLAAEGLVDAGEYVGHLDSSIVVELFGWLVSAPSDGLDAIAEALWRAALSSTVGSEAWNSRDLKSRPH